ncbi:MAG: LysM domain-containing protein, partial [Anaerolineales bacterium]|nr:LysM domain-containing protein [Anaerolineales bacterium]
MQNDFKEDVSNPDETAEQPAASASSRRGNFFARTIISLVQMGLGESLLRVGTNLFSMIAIGIVILLAQIFYHQANPLPEPDAANLPVSAPASTDMNPLPKQSDLAFGVFRAAQIHTNIPSRPRQEIVKYVVQDGDTVFGIAEKFGLEPQTILWGNFDILYDDPHS